MPSPAPLPTAKGSDLAWSTIPPCSQQSCGDPGGDLLDRFSSLVLTIAENVQLHVAPLREPVSSAGTSFRVPASSLNAQTPVHLPQAGPSDPNAVLSTCLPFGTPGEVGFGWTHAYRPTVQPSTTGPTTVTTGTGAAYTTKNPSTGYYVPPGTTQNSLNSDASNLTETQPDGPAFRYSTAGRINYIKGPAGASTTVTYSSMVTASPVAVVTPTN
jgi:hypothetical protein